MRRPCTFRQRDATALIKAVVAAGCEVARVEMGKDGKIVVVPKTGTEPTSLPTCNEVPNEWDEVISDAS